MNHAFRTICLALLFGVLAGAGAAAYVLALGTHSKIGLEFEARNGRRHVELGHLNTGDDAVSTLKFWGLKVGYGDSLTTIGVYTPRTPRLPE